MAEGLDGDDENVCDVGVGNGCVLEAELELEIRWQGSA